MDTTHNPDALDVNLGLALRTQRKVRRLSQQEVGALVGVSFQQIQKYERGANRVSFSMLVRLCEALNCTIGDLVVDVGVISDSGRPVEQLMQPEVSALLNAFADVSNPIHRRAMVDLARSLRDPELACSAAA